MIVAQRLTPGSKCSAGAFDYPTGGAVGTERIDLTAEDVR